MQDDGYHIEHAKAIGIESELARRGFRLKRAGRELWGLVLDAAAMIGLR